MNPLLSALAQWAEALANGTFALDSDARAGLAALDGRSIQLETPFDEPIALEFTGTHLRVMARALEQPNAIVRGSPAALLTAALGGSPDDLRIDGDEALVHEFTALVRRVRPDFTEPLTTLVGEPGAETLLGFLELGGRALGRAAEELRGEGSRAFARTAQRRFLDAHALEGFASDVFDAQLALDRLDARITALEGSRS